MAILLWYMAVIAVWTPVTKTSINENCYFHPGKREVWSALKRVMSPPTSNVECFQKFNEGLLSRTIMFRPNSAHHERSFLLGENVQLYLLPPRSFSMRRISAAGLSDNSFHFCTL